MFSYEEGVKKPALEIYERMVRRIGANSAEILFVDDKLVNVEGARRAGMRAVEFTNLPDLRRRIDGLL